MEKTSTIIYSGGVLKTTYPFQVNRSASVVFWFEELSETVMRSDGWTGGVDAMQAVIPEITSRINMVHRSISERTVAPGNKSIFLWRNAMGIGFVILTGIKVSYPAVLSGLTWIKGIPEMEQFFWKTQKEYV
jgi:hypothetical protein